jgi:hypothetical protein
MSEEEGTSICRRLKLGDQVGDYYLENTYIV